MADTPAAVRFDHFISHLDGPTLDRHLETYRAAGFAVADLTVKHEPGLRTGFVFFGSMYIEFAWVEDEAEFAAGATQEVAYRAAHRPYGIGFVSQDVQAVHDDWVKRGYGLPNVFSKAPRDAPPKAPPAWSFQEIPPSVLAGADCFVLTYHIYPQEVLRSAAMNTTYDILGPVFVAEDPQQRANGWRDLLAPGRSIRSVDQGHELQLGPTLATWLSPDAYRSRFGREWVPAPHANGELALLTVLATDLNAVASTLERSDWPGVPMEGGIFVPPNPVDGFSFLIKEAKREE